MDHRTFKTFLLCSLAAVGCVLLVLAVSGVGDAVVIKAGTINTANGTLTPLLEDLIKCPFQGAGGVIADNASANFVLVDCSGADGVLINLTHCNAALTAVNTITLTTGTMATAMPLLRYSVLPNSPYTAGYFATYAAGIHFTKATGVAFQVNLEENAPAANAESIESLIQGARGLVNLTGDSSPKLPVAIYAVDSADGANPCLVGNDLSGINVTAQYDRSPGTVAYLMLNVSDTGSAQCDVALTNTFKAGKILDSFDSGTGACSVSNFGGHDPKPPAFYTGFFANVSTIHPNNPVILLTGIETTTGLNFYPHLSASGVIANTTDLASAIACINSTDSRSAGYGTVRAFVVRCFSFHTGLDLELHFKACQTALHTVRGIVGNAPKLLVSAQLSTFPGATAPPISLQAQLAVAAIYDTAVDGAVIRLEINKDASTPAQIQANFDGAGAVASAFSALYLQAGQSSDKFNLILHFDQSDCAPGGPLAPQGQEGNQTSIYTSCNVDGVNCLFTTTYATATSTDFTTCGFPMGSVLSWEAIRGVATALTSSAEPNATDCNATAITPAYHSPTIASINFLDGPAFRFGPIGAFLTPEEAGTEANAACVFSEDGAAASYGVVLCDLTSGDFPDDCVAGFEALRAVNGSAAIVASVAPNANSREFTSLAMDTGRLLGKARWAGVYIDFIFFGEATSNIDDIVTFVETMVGATTLPAGSDLTIGIRAISTAECMPGGDLYQAEENSTMNARLTSVVSEGISYVMFFGDTPNTTVTELCGFNTTRLGYEAVVDRTFGGTCSSVTLAYDLLALPPAVAPVNPSGGSGSTFGLHTSLGPLFGFIALLLSLAL